VLCQPWPSPGPRSARVISSSPCQKCRARSGSSAGSSIRKDGGNARHGSCVALPPGSSRRCDPSHTGVCLNPAASDFPQRIGRVGAHDGSHLTFLGRGRARVLHLSNRAAS
jgi:hypothetical protein